MDSGKTEVVAKENYTPEHQTEYTHSGHTFTPDVDIFESQDAITLIADMPGVKAEDLTIDLKDNMLTISGDVALPEIKGEEIRLMEYATGRFFRQFKLSELISQEQIQAKLRQGVLRLTLPKIERAKPRKIQVMAEG